MIKVLVTPEEEALSSINLAVQLLASSVTHQMYVNQNYEVLEVA